MTNAPASRHRFGPMSPRHAQLVETTMIWCGTSTGSANAQIIAPEFAADMKGHPTYVWVAGYSNTNAMTLSADGGATTPSHRKADGTAFVGGEIVAGTIYQSVWDGTYWRLIGGAGAGSSFTGASSKSTNYTILSSDGGSVIKATAALTFTLPAASGLSGTWWVTISNRSTGIVIIAPAGADTIAGLAVPVVLRSGQDITIYRTGTGTYEVVGLSQSVTDSQATWSAVNKAAGITLSNGNMTATSTSGVGSVLGTVGVSGGKRYFECRLVSAVDGTVGLARSTMSLSNAVGVADANGWGYINDGRKVSGGTYTAYGSSVSDNGIVMVAADIDAGKMWIGVNGVWQGSGDPVAGTNPTFTGVTGTLYPAFGDQGSQSPSGTLIVSLASFSYSPPTGYTTFY